MIRQTRAPSRLLAFPRPPNVPLAWETFAKDLQALSDRLATVRPLVIDYFLSQNEDLQDIGKFVIAWVLLECEREFDRLKGNPNRLDELQNSSPDGQKISPRQVNFNRYKDDWYRFIISELVNGCPSSESILRNNVHFITFNYDVSLERNLFQRLRQISKFEKSHIEEFLGKERFIHVYGQVRDYRSDLDFPQPDVIKSIASKSLPRDPQTMDPIDQFNGAIDFSFACSEGIRTIGNQEKDQERNAIKKSKDLLSLAENIYILGYGFDANNSQRIGLHENLCDSQKNVRFTNYNDSNTINKKALRILVKNPNDRLYFENPIRIGEMNWHEKSVRDVYGALEHDFPHFEQS